MTDQKHKITKLTEAIALRKAMIKNLSQSGIFLCELDREEALIHQQAISHLRKQLELLLN